MWSVYGNSHIWDVVMGRSVFVNSIDANAALAGWMHRVCADLCVHPVIRLYRTQTLRRGRPLRRPARIDMVLLFVDVDVDVDAHAALAG